MKLLIISITLTLSACATYAPTIPAYTNSSENPISESNNQATGKIKSEQNEIDSIKWACEENVDQCKLVNKKSLSLRDERAELLVNMCLSNHADSCSEIGNRYFNEEKYIESIKFYKLGCKLKNENSCKSIKESKAAQIEKKCDDEANSSRSSTLTDEKPGDPLEGYKQKCDSDDLQSASACMSTYKILLTKMKTEMIDLGDVFYYYEKACDLNKKLCSKSQKFFNRYDPKRPKKCKPLDISAYMSFYPRDGGIEEGAIYHGTLEIIQKTHEGYLMTPRIVVPGSGPRHEPIFVKMSREWDTHGFNGWLYLIGKYQYTAIDGFKRSVPMFRSYPGRLNCADEEALSCLKHSPG